MNKQTKFFITKQDRLKAALERVQKKLAEFKQLSETHFYEPYDQISEEERQKWRDEMDTWKWNDWNDLETRIENRLIDNYSDYNQYFFDKHGW